MSNLSIKKRKAKSAKVRMTVKEFNDELLNLMTIQDEMERLNTIGQQLIRETNEIYDKIEEFKEFIEYLTTSPTKNHNGKETAIKMISTLKAELECKQDLIMQEEFETGKIFSGLYYKRRISQDELKFVSLKLEKLGVSKIEIDVVKKSNNLGHSFWWDRLNN